MNDLSVARRCFTVRRDLEIGIVVEDSDWPGSGPTKDVMSGESTLLSSRPSSSFRAWSSGPGGESRLVIRFRNLLRKIELENLLV